MLEQDLKNLILKQAELDNRQAQLIELQAEIEILKQESNQQRIIIWEKLYRLKQIWQERGTLDTFRFIFHKIRKKQKSNISYQKWFEDNQLKGGEIVHQQITQMKLHPKFSVIMPVYNVKAKWLKKAIESVRKQIYPDWELCIADDASTQSHIRPLLEKYSKLDSRIKVVFRKENGHISAASNSALELATGDYIALLDNDDELTTDALFENAKLINEHPEADFIYSNEDKIDTKGNLSEPFFKPDWSPEYFHSCMYTCHLGVYRTKLIREIKGFRSKYDGSQDYDLVLRFVEKTNNIYHIPKILYHWRKIPTSAAFGTQAKPWAYKAGWNALESMLERSLYPGCVSEQMFPGSYRVRREIIDQPLVSIIIPSAGKLMDTNKAPICILKKCIQSIRALSTYRNFEIILVDGYDIADSILKEISGTDLTIVHCAEPFNFSMRINMGVSKATGQFLLLLNDDIEVITPDWIESMLEFAQQDEIGAVGAKLFSADGKIQHTGIILFEGIPEHVFYQLPGDHLGYLNFNYVNKNYLAVTAACLMLRKELFEQIGKLDEEFPINYGDVDLCMRIHQAGYRNVITPFAQLIHYESISRGEGAELEEKKQFKQKWQNYLDYLGGDPYYHPIFENRGGFGF